MSRVAHNRDILAYYAVAALDVDYGFAALVRLVQKLRHTVECVRAENQVYLRVHAADFLGDMLLLHHTAAQDNHHMRAAFLYMLQNAYPAENLVLGILAHRAGVEHDQVGDLCVVGKVIPGFFQHTAYALGIVFVLLAAVRLAQRKRASAVFRLEHIASSAEQLCVALLLRQLGSGYLPYHLSTSFDFTKYKYILSHFARKYNIKT